MSPLSGPRAAFWAKSALAVILVMVADAVFYRQAPGANLGAYGLLLSLAVLVAGPAVRRDPRAMAALSVAVGAAALSVEHPTLTMTGLLSWPWAWPYCRPGRARPTTPGRGRSAWAWECCSASPAR
jgi:hypothetical protein